MQARYQALMAKIKRSASFDRGVDILGALYVAPSVNHLSISNAVVAYEACRYASKCAACRVVPHLAPADLACPRQGQRCWGNLGSQ